MSSNSPIVVGADGVQRPTWWHHAGMRCMAALAPGWQLYDEVYRLTEYDSGLLKKIQNERLRAVLRLSGEEEDWRAAFSRTPVMTKSHLLNNLTNLRSGLVDPVDVLRVRTSGTTGEPISIEHGEAHLVDGVASQLRMLSAFNLTPGVPVLRVTCDPRHDLVSFTSQSAHVLTTVLRVNVSKLNTSNASFVNEACRSFAPQVVWGQPLEMLVAATQIRNGLLARPKVKMIWTHGDTLGEQTRSALTDVFQTPHRDIYGMQEFGQLGWECPDAPGTYHMNEERVLVERDIDGALVLTSLINNATSIVRYRPEDRAEFVEGECPCGRTLRRLTKLQGRQRGFIIDRNNNPMNVKPLQLHMEALPLRRWQVRQERQGAVSILIVPNESLARPDIEELASQARAMLNLASVDVQEVSLEDLMTKAGKAPQFRLLMTQRHLSDLLGGA